MTRQASFFDPAEMTPQARAASPVVTKAQAEARTANWRAPGEREEACAVCGGAAAFAMGAMCWCRDHLPPGFMPGGRGQP